MTANRAIIVTERLTVAPWTTEDADQVFEMDRDPRVMEPLKRPVLSAEESAQQLQQTIADYRGAGGLGIWKCTLQKGEVIGAANLNHPVVSASGKREGPIQLGYRVKPRYRKQGYATEMTLGLLHYGFGQLRLARIIGLTTNDNPASARVMQKAGMEALGTTTEYYHQSMLLFALRRDQWQPHIDAMRGNISQGRSD